jgi:calcineurin-like phosphoesterase family protein
MNLFTSDLHFGHSNVIKFDQRPFENVDEMDHALIELWNSRVQPEDNIYIVGDFCYRNTHPEEWYLQQLKGHKHLVIGNHDAKLLKNAAAMEYFESVDKMMHVVEEGRHICLCHFPIIEWHGYYKGHWHIYGHIHSRKSDTYTFMKTRERALNAGCMINNYMLVSFNELIENNRRFQETRRD